MPGREAIVALESVGAEASDANAPATVREPVARVLVIDDSEDIHGLVTFCINVYWPRALVEMYDPAKGMPGSRFAWDSYDLLLLDFELGRDDGNGLDWLRALGRHPQLPPTIMITAHGNEALAVSAIKLGASDYINKEDLSPKALALAVKDAMAARGHDTAALLGDRADSVVDYAERTQILSRSQQNEPTPAIASVAAGAEAEKSSPRLEGAADPGLASRECEVPGYRIVRQLGEGGMATVYLARREEDDLEVTLKVLFLGAVEDPDLLQRFMREHSALRQLHHPHVVQIHERGFASDFAYIAMEYFPAGDLSMRVQHSIEAARALSYARQLALGLGAAHAMGIVHRDVKPGNVLFRHDDTLALTDFGIVKFLQRGPTQTETGSLVGTPRYMSPEQILGRALDIRTDLYALGVVLFEMLTGAIPFSATSIGGLAHAHVHQPIPRLVGDLARWQPLIDGLLAKNPDERFQGADEVVEAIDMLSA